MSGERLQDHWSSGLNSGAELKFSDAMMKRSITKIEKQINKSGTVNFLNIRTPKKFVVITLKFELCGSTIE